MVHGLPQSSKRAFSFYFPGLCDSLGSPPLSCPQACLRSLSISLFPDCVGCFLPTLLLDPLSLSPPHSVLHGTLRGNFAFWPQLGSARGRHAGGQRMRGEGGGLFVCSAVSMQCLGVSTPLPQRPWILLSCSVTANLPLIRLSQTPYLRSLSVSCWPWLIDWPMDMVSTTILDPTCPDEHIDTLMRPCLELLLPLEDGRGN